MTRTVLVAGASGLVGTAAVEAFLEDGWEVVAVSRRKPETTSQRPFTHLAVDLQDEAACRQAFGDLTDVTHVVYAAVFEKPGLVAGWTEDDQMQTNLAMLRNLIEPLLEHSALEHVTTLQGTKAYGIHLHPMRVPAKERHPRDDHANFYWLQEDYIKEKAAQRAGLRWTIFRPQLVVGANYGVVMSLVPVIGAYAAIRKEEGLPFSYPGGAPAVWEAVDTRLIARAALWAATEPKADGQHFNLTNGDVFDWRDLWPSLADQLGVAVGPDEPFSMAEYMPSKSDVWDRVVRKHGLRPLTMSQLLGESHHFADFLFIHGVTEPPPPAFVSTIKIREAGFNVTYDTEDCFRHWLQVLQDRKVLPSPS